MRPGRSEEAGGSRKVVGGQVRMLWTMLRAYKRTIQQTDSNKVLLLQHSCLRIVHGQDDTCDLLLHNWQNQRL